MGKAAFIVCSMLIGLLVHYAECTSTPVPSKQTTQKLPSTPTPANQTTPSSNSSSAMTTGASNETTQKLSSTPTSASQTTPSSSSSSAMTTGPSKQTTQKLPSTTTEDIRDFISGLIKSGISDGMKALLNAVVSNSESTTESTTGSSTTSQTTASTDVTSSSTSSASSSTSTARMATTCPEGLYDQNSETVTFAMEDKDCQITIYLTKPPKKQKSKKEKKVKENKKGKNKREKDRNQDQDQGKERFLEKNISIGPIHGMEIDQCPEVTSRQYGKDGFLVQTSECSMYVKNIKKGRKGNNRSQTPLILSQALGQ